MSGMSPLSMKQHHKCPLEKNKIIPNHNCGAVWDTIGRDRLECITDMELRGKERTQTVSIYNQNRIWRRVETIRKDEIARKSREPQKHREVKERKATIWLGATIKLVEQARMKDGIAERVRWGHKSHHILSRKKTTTYRSGGVERRERTDICIHLTPTKHMEGTVEVKPGMVGTALRSGWDEGQKPPRLDKCVTVPTHFPTPRPRCTTESFGLGIPKPLRHLGSWVNTPLLPDDLPAKILQNTSSKNSKKKKVESEKLVVINSDDSDTTEY